MPNAPSSEPSFRKSRTRAKRQATPSAECRVAYSRSRAGVSLESKLMLTSSRRRAPVRCLARSDWSMRANPALDSVQIERQRV